MHRPLLPHPSLHRWCRFGYRMRAHRTADGPNRSPSTARDCAHRDTSVCEDCVVSFIVGRQPEDALVVDADAGPCRATARACRAGPRGPPSRR